VSTLGATVIVNQRDPTLDDVECSGLCMRSKAGRANITPPSSFRPGGDVACDIYSVRGGCHTLGAAEAVGTSSRGGGTYQYCVAEAFEATSVRLSIQ
jgi:hypothetical protein